MRLFIILICLFLASCGLISNGKIKYHRVNSFKNQVDTISFDNTVNIKLALDTFSKSANNRVMKEQNHSKSAIKKNKSLLKLVKIDNNNKNGQKVLTDNYLKQIPFYGASKHNTNNTQFLNLNPENKNDALFITLLVLGVLAIIVLIFLGVIYLGLDYPIGGIGSLALAFLILLTIILVAIIRNRKPNKHSNEKDEKLENRRGFWRAFGAIFGAIVVIVLTILLL